jgi:hypothetical protein
MRILTIHLLAGFGLIWSSSLAADWRLTTGLPRGGARLLPLAAPAPCAPSHPFFFDIMSSSPFHPANLRRHYEQAAADKAAGEKFYKLLADYKDRDGLVLAYKGAAEAIRARDASMFNKLAYVQDAARTFEQAVSLDPRNPEIRFLRFSVESNLPPFLGLSKHVDEDKEMLLNAALAHPNSGLDAEAFRTVRGFLVGRGHVSGAEAERLNRVAE